MTKIVIKSGHPMVGENFEFYLSELPKIVIKLCHPTMGENFKIYLSELTKIQLNCWWLKFMIFT